MNWNHCEDFGEEEFMYKEKQVLANMYMLDNPEYKIAHDSDYTTRELYELAIEINLQELLDIIINTHVTNH